MRQSIWNINKRKSKPERFCDVIVDEDKVSLEVKNSRKETVTIPFADLVDQVNEAIKTEKEGK